MSVRHWPRVPRRLAPFSVAATLLFPGPLSIGEPGGQARVEAIRFWSFGDVTRVAVQTNGEYKLESDQIETPPRVYFDLRGLKPPGAAHHGIETIQVGDHRVKQIRVAEVSPGRTRIVFDLEGPVETVASQLVNPDRLMIEIRPKGAKVPGLSIAHSVMGSRRVDLSGSENVANVPAPDSNSSGANPPATQSRTLPPLVQTLPSTRPSPPAAAIVTAANHSEGSTAVKVTPLESHDVPLAQPARLPVSAPPASASSAGSSLADLPKTPADSPKVLGPGSPASRAYAGDHSLVRVFGLKLGKVVIDAGHGGHDTGTVGPNGLMEKSLVLDVALRLGKLITQQLGAEVVYTRSGDVFLPLEERTRIANAEKADLFISVHANASPESSATGVETYFFNLTSDRSGLDLAMRENATSASSISDLNDLLHKAVLQTKLEESRAFAQKVQSSLWACSVKMNNHSRDRGVRQAPFVVLIGATMPSILAEIGFVSNPHDERLMKRNDQRQKIAEALFKGISQYAGSLGHLQMARARASD